MPNLSSDPTAPDLARRSRRPLHPVTEAGTVPVFRCADMVAWGIDPDRARSFVRQGLWVRLHRGVYADAAVVAAARADPAQYHLLLARAAIAALPVAAYATGATSSLVHGLPRPNGLPEDVHLVRAAGNDQRALRRRVTRPSALTGVRVHQHALLASEVTDVDGIAVVSRDVAAVTSAAAASPHWAVAILDAAAWQRSDGVESLRAVADRWTHLPGVGAVRDALALTRTGAQSPFESLSRLRLVECGLPEPDLQVAFWDSTGLIGYADMVWEEWGVIGECDGLAKYHSRDDLIREKEREDRLRALGYVVVRWTWRELTENPAAVAARIVRARALASTHRRAVSGIWGP
jgi:hypothetical protein